MPLRGKEPRGSTITCYRGRLGYAGDDRASLQFGPSGVCSHRGHSTRGKRGRRRRRATRRGLSSCLSPSVGHPPLPHTRGRGRHHRYVFHNVGRVDLVSNGRTSLLFYVPRFPPSFRPSRTSANSSFSPKHRTFPQCPSPTTPFLLSTRPRTSPVIPPSQGECPSSPT